MAQNSIEKIAQQYAVRVAPDTRVHSGDYIFVQPKHVMTHDNTGAVIPKFRSIGAERVARPEQPVFTLDHNVQDRSEENLAKYKAIAEFALQQGITAYPAGAGIGHQLMLEEGFVTPGSLVVASDSHSNIYGALATVGTPVVRTDAAAIWASGETWWQVPPVVRVTLSGELPPGVTGKDVIITLCGTFNNDEVLNCAIEFCGAGVSSLTIADRMTIANMSTEWGALAAFFPFDEKTRDFFLQQAERLSSTPSPRLKAEEVRCYETDWFRPDPDACYAAEITRRSPAPTVSGKLSRWLRSISRASRSRKPTCSPASMPGWRICVPRRTWCAGNRWPGAWNFTWPPPRPRSRPQRRRRASGRLFSMPERSLSLPAAAPASAWGWAR